MTTQMTPEQLAHHAARAADCQTALTAWLSSLPTSGLEPVRRAEELVETDIPALIEAIRASWQELAAVRSALLELHPEIAAPRHGCCAEPTVCQGHRPECGSREHGLASGTPFPCRTLRVAGIASDADAAAVRAGRAPALTEAGR